MATVWSQYILGVLLVDHIGMSWSSQFHIVEREGCASESGLDRGNGELEWVGRIEVNKARVKLLIGLGPQP